MQAHVFVRICDEVDGIMKPDSGVRLGKTIDLPFPPVPGCIFRFQGDDLGLQFIVNSLELLEAPEDVRIKTPPWSPFEHLIHLRAVIIPDEPMRESLIDGLVCNGWEKVIEKTGLDKAIGQITRRAKEDRIED